MFNQYGLGVFNTKVTNKIAKVTPCWIITPPCREKQYSSVFVSGKASDQNVPDFFFLIPYQWIAVP